MPAPVQEAKKLMRLQDRKKAIVQRMKTIDESAGDDSLSEEEQKEWDTLQEEEKSVDELIARAEYVRNLELSMDATKTYEPNIGNVKDNAQDDPMRGFKKPQEFFEAVMQAERRPSMRDPRLIPLAAVGSDEFQTQSDPHGGYLVPEAMAPNLLTLSPDEDPLAGRVTRIPMGAPTVKIPSRVDYDHSDGVSGGFTVRRRYETQEMTASRRTMEMVTLEANSLYGLAYATEELIADSPQSIAALIAEGFEDAFGQKLIDERINGTGAGEFLGILNSPATITVSKESGQAADTINATNVLKMKARSWNYGNSVWLANHDAQVQLSQLHIAVTEGVIANYYTSLADGTMDMLMGRPIIYTEYAKALGLKGDLILGDWSQYLEGVYQGVRRDESIHVRFLSNERAFRFTMRNAGAPWWRSPVTPVNGSGTLAPFVVLEERG